jgi:hypothetical protein
MRLLTTAQEVKFAADAKLYYRSGMTSLSQRPSVKAFEAAILSTDLGCGYLLSIENSTLTRKLCADRYKEWLFRIYPVDEQLVTKLENKIRELGGSNRKMDGGKLFHLLCFFFGWKKAKLFKEHMLSKGYKKLPFN